MKNRGVIASPSFGGFAGISASIGAVVAVDGGVAAHIAIVAMLFSFAGMLGLCAYLLSWDPAGIAE